MCVCIYIYIYIHLLLLLLLLLFFEALAKDTSVSREAVLSFVEPRIRGPLETPCEIESYYYHDY